MQNTRERLQIQFVTFFWHGFVFFVFPFHWLCVFVVIIDIVEDFCFQFIDGVKITTGQDTSCQAAEPDFDLVQPRTMFRRAVFSIWGKTYPVTFICQKRLATFQRFQYATRYSGQTTLLPFTPRSIVMPKSLATKITSDSDWCVLRWSSTITQPSSGAVTMTFSIFFTKSTSVRVGFNIGAIISPVATFKLPIKHVVPWRSSLYSRFSTKPGIIGFVGASRSSGWIPVFSSMLTVWMLFDSFSAAAWYVSQISLTSCSNCSRWSFHRSSWHPSFEWHFKEFVRRRPVTESVEEIDKILEFILSQEVPRACWHYSLKVSQIIAKVTKEAYMTSSLSYRVKTRRKALIRRK